MLTLKEFDLLPKGEVFATGVLPNSFAGIFMTNDGGLEMQKCRMDYAIWRQSS